MTQLFGLTHLAFPVAPLADLSGGDLIRMVSLSIPLGALALGAVAIVVSMKAKLEREKFRHETIRMALEKGQALPPEFLNPAQFARPDHPNADRRNGLVLIAIGVGLFVVLRALNHGYPQVSWLGLIPGVIGAALLLNWRLDQRSKPGSDQP